MFTLAEFSNPFFLKELYLDGCDKITDDSIRTLTNHSGLVNHSFLENALQNDQILDIFQSLAYDEVDAKTFMHEVRQGGARGL